VVFDNEHIILDLLYILYIRLASSNAREKSVSKLYFQNPEPNTKSGPYISEPKGDLRWPPAPAKLKRQAQGLD
jgi:hypothetical protein